MNHFPAISCLILMLDTAAPDASLTVKSTAFAHNAAIPSKYTCEGANVNPPLSVSGIPDGTKSLALIMDDPDAPRGHFRPLGNVEY